MFLTHQSEIQRFASLSARNTNKVLTFVQVTIQQRFDHVPNMIEEINNTGTCKRLTTRQRDSIAVYRQREDEIFSIVFSSASVSEKLAFLASLPGFGLPKAGFVLQLLIGRVGCLDVHNLKRFGIKASAFVLRNGSPSNQNKIDKYISICDTELGCGYLWDSWCQLIAEKYNKVYQNAEHVSRLHVDCIRNLK